MSLSAVLLIHVSSLGYCSSSSSSSSPRAGEEEEPENRQQATTTTTITTTTTTTTTTTQAQENDEDDDDDDDDDDEEYYQLLELPKYASLPEIRKAFRHVSQRLACERMNIDLQEQQQMQQQQMQQQMQGEGGPVVVVVEEEEEYPNNININNNKNMKKKKKLDEKEQKIKQAFYVLGDEHLRQQYHLLACQPSRYRIACSNTNNNGNNNNNNNNVGPLQFIQNATQPGRWIPLLVLQSVLIAALVNATTAQEQTQNAWVGALIPVWVYYGMVVLFWFGMMEPLPLLPAAASRVVAKAAPAALVKLLLPGSFWGASFCSSRSRPRRRCRCLGGGFFWRSCSSSRRRRRSVVTLHGWWTMFCNFAQHASLWLGLFFMARTWDYNAVQLHATTPGDDDEQQNERIMNSAPSWYLVSIPFYLAIFFRCYCTKVAVASLRHVQSKMVSRQQMEQHQQQQQQQQQTPGTAEEEVPNTTTTTTSLPEGYIVVTGSSKNEKRSRLDSTTNYRSILSTSSDNNESSTTVVKNSPEYRQVDYTVHVLKRSAIQLAILGSAFIALVTLKVDNVTNHQHIHQAFDNISFWVVFIPIWIHLACRIIFSCYCRSPKYHQQHASTATATTTTVTAAGAAAATNTTAAVNHPRSKTRSRRHNNNSSTTTRHDFSVSNTPRKEPFNSIDVDANDARSILVEAAADTTQSMDTLEKGSTMMAVTTRSLGVGESTSVGIIELAPALTYVRFHKKEGLTTNRNSIEEEDEKDQTTAASSSSRVQMGQKAGPQQLDNGDAAAAGATTNESSKEQEQSQLFDVETGLDADGESIEQYQEEAESSAGDQSEQREYFDAVEKGPDETTKIALAGRTNDDAGENQSTPKEEEDAHVHEEYERWQSVYENAELRATSTPCPIPCSVVFQILICYLIVKKLDVDYGNDDPENAGFNAFLIILIPFMFALFICCFTIAVACCCHVARVGLNPRTTESSDTGNSSPTGEALQITNGNGRESDGSLDETPMQAGPGLYQRMAFSTHIDIVRNDFDFHILGQVFAMALDVPSGDAKEWLVLHGNRIDGKEATFWEQITTFADEIDCQSVNNDEQCFEGLKSIDQDWLVLLRINLQAHFDKTKFQNDLDAIAPLYVDGGDVVGFDDEELGGSCEEGAGIECLVCCEVYKIMDTVHCEGDPIHFFCRQCFHRYMTETVDSGDIAGLPCADVDCNSTFATPVARENLSAWEVLRMQDREMDRNTRVALAAKAVLKCPCGAIGIVSDKDIGDGCITCPGSDCGLQYCALCGNKWHPDMDCPPTKKMLQWVVKNTMPCPNCHTPLVKNGGCDHMHCAPPGGCGHHFSYSTGKPMTSNGRTLRGLYNT